MKKNAARIDLVKMALFLLKHCWLWILLAAVGFGFMYYRASKQPDTYTARGTLMVSNNNPNQQNYGYYSISDQSSAVQLISTYSVLLRSERVMDKVLEYPVDVLDDEGNPTGETQLLSQKYPGLTAGAIAGSISMRAQNETSVAEVRCTTTDPYRSMDICNAVIQTAPKQLAEVSNAGKAEMVDAAKLPRSPNARNERSQGMTGAIGGAAIGAALLALIFLLNQKVTEAKELREQYTIPVLTSVKRDKKENKDPGSFLLNSKSPMDVIESYAKLRMNLIYTLVEKQSHTVMVTSAISGEGKSTIAANLAISFGMAGKRVLLIDADMRRTCQRDVFHYDADLPGLSDTLIGACKWQSAVLHTERENLDILPAGHLPPNPAELLESAAMHELIRELEAAYDLVLLDTPPINIVSDPLALSRETAGAVFVVRQNYSDHREIRKALRSAEMTGMELLGFVFYGEHLKTGTYYSYRHYKGYYYHHRYDTRDQTQNRLDLNTTTTREEQAHEQAQYDEAAPAAPADDGHRRHRRSDSGSDADTACPDGD
ncbi:MAG: polysaccharide biosynthesis tyrosine autokinase [Clostridia bacterium]|nr:polysaccharide biosynthesis tyrosine autokinase [Clostridia bacterium]